ncbi:hypothetical protein ACFSCZ_01420 [Siminovitchia sediminis]|uniref:Uncharacterized protein n=1 Tax=Siminovitchia sediminis TaxID=1274353 RepID=A0ABW4KC84_9BACI
MNKHRTRMAASILLMTAIILVIIQNNQLKSNAASSPKEGLMEVKKSDYEGLKKESEQWKLKYEQLKKEKSKEQQVVKVMHLHIQDGMTSKDVSKQMEEAGVIDDADSLNEFLASQNWQQAIQIGKYEVNSEMSIKEIAEIITGS